MVKLPVGDDESGASSGKADFAVDGIVSGYNRVVEIAGYGGVIMRGNPDGYQLTNGLRWGVGAASRSVTTWASESQPSSSANSTSTTRLPRRRRYRRRRLVRAGDDVVKSPVIDSLGLTWQAPNGFFIGGAARGT